MALLTLGGSATLAHIITRPRHLRPIRARQIDETIEEITFTTPDGLTRRGWYLRHEAPRDLLIICHGYAMSRHELLDLAQALLSRGHAVLLFDFRGHGTSGGRRSTIGYRESGDVIAAIDYLHTRPELAGLPIGVAGISMGAAASLLAAAREPRIAAVAADSSFAALAESASGNLRQLCHAVAIPLGPLIIHFSELLTHARIGINRPIDAIGAIAPRPVLIIHDSNDTFIPVRNALALHDAAGAPKALWIQAGRGHASLWACCAAEYVERLDNFFTQALGATLPSAA
jgi:alpha-beta hydrolase superfamily lysophospholipase